MAEMTLRMTPGQKIREIRKARGLTAVQLADRIGVSHDLVSSWEQGRRRICADYIPAICNALEISPLILFGLFFDEEPLPDSNSIRTQLAHINKSINIIYDILGGKDNGEQ